MKEIEIQINGIPHTVQVDDDVADAHETARQEAEAKAAEEKTAAEKQAAETAAKQQAPANKSATPANK